MSGNNTEIKPCPFCGGEVSPIWVTRNGEYSFTGEKDEELTYFRCYGCDAEVFFDTPNGNKAKISLWNRRAKA